MNNLFIQKLTKIAENNEKILTNINLQFIEGKRYCIFGPSGCGKTTLLNIISFVDQNYTGGIFFNDINIKDIESIEKNSYKRYIVSYIKQNNVLFENLTTEENINIPHATTQDIKTKRKSKKVKVLSGGQYKKVAIEQILNKETKILLADEPTSNLDSTNAKMVMDTLSEFCNDKIFVFVTHDRNVAENYADEIIELKDGKCKRNYNKRAKGEEFSLPKPPRIKTKNRNIFSKIFFKRNKKFTSLFNENLISLLISFSLLLSIYSGIKLFFSDQLKFTEDLTYITLKQPNYYENINDEDIALIFEITGQKNFKKKFIKEEPVQITVCGVPFYVDSTLITRHNETYNKLLTDDTIILQCNEKYRDVLENSLEIENLDDYFESNECYINLYANHEIFEFKIYDILFSNKVESIQLIHSDELFYEKFWNENDNFVWTIDKDLITNDLIEYINLSNNYFLVESDLEYEILKAQNNLLSYDKLSKINEDFLLSIDNDSYLLKEENGLYYFNDLKASKNSKTSEGIIYYTPYKNALKVGRYAIDSNEISISTVLAKELGINEPNLIKLEFKNYSEYFYVAGIFESDDRYIYQSPKWINTAYENLTNNLIKQKSLNAVCFIEPIKSQNLIDILKDVYPNAYIFSPVTETIITLESTVNKVLIVGSSFLLLLFIIAIFAIYLVSKVEISSMTKAINHVESMGFYRKDLNDIFKKLLYRRLLFSFLLSQTVSILMILIVNNIMKQQMAIEENILTYNFFIPILVFLISLVIIIVDYNVLKYKKRKPKV